MQLINQEFSRKFYQVMLVILAFSLPLHFRLVGLTILITGLFWIVEFNFKDKWDRLKDIRLNRQMLSFGLLYLMYVVGVFYSSNLNERYTGAFSNLEEKMSLLVFPLLLSTISMERMKNSLFISIQKAFILGCLLSSLYLLGVASFSYFQNNNIQEFYYTGLSEFHHTSYLAMYFSLAIAMLLNSLLFPEKVTVWSRNLSWSLILFFQLMIVLLSSKAGILGLSLIYGAAFIFLQIFRVQPSKRRWLPLIFMGLFFTTLFLFPQSFNRFYSLEQTMDEQPAQQVDEAESTVARMLIWKSALELISENPVWGVGTGDIKDELLKKYKEKKIIPAFEQKLNAHNQFLQTYIGIGIIGFLLLVGSLVVPAYIAFRKKQLLYFLFLLVILMHMSVESILEKQDGVVFYAFFNVLLFYMSFSPTSEIKLTKV